MSRSGDLALGALLAVFFLLLVWITWPWSVYALREDIDDLRGRIETLEAGGE